MAWQDKFRSGLVHQEAGRLDSAERSFRAAIAANPGFAEAHYNLGVVLQARGRFRPALHAFELASRLNPTLVEARIALGVILTRIGDPARAEAELRAAIAQSPKTAEGHRFLGDLLRNLGRVEEARVAYAEALRCNPADGEAQFGVAFVRLARGEFPDAWDNYECRKSRSDAQALRPVWNGEDLAGKTILVHGEQGLGDAVQFLRYVPLLSACGAKVLVAVPREIMALAATVEGVSAVLEPSYDIPSFDFSCPLPSLPRGFRTTLADIPRAVPYLHVDAGRISDWRDRLGKWDGPTVAIAWSGNEKHPDNYRRSIELADLAPVFKTPQTRFLVVQRDDRNAPRAANVIRCGSQDLNDIAAILSVADLTISVDTLFCHLAAALGRPVWALLAVSPDWRWGPEGETTPWYPTMRLFRQQAVGDWREVVGRAAHALSTFKTGIL